MNTFIAGQIFAEIYPLVTAAESIEEVECIIWE
jgi:hypothetical protein